MSISSPPAKSNSRASITKLMSILGGFDASIFAIAIPSIYFAISLNGIEYARTSDAAFLAKSVEKIIQARPDLWEFESVRLKELISQPSLDGNKDEREIRDAKRRLITKTDFTELPPTISVSRPFFDSGRFSGMIVVRHSLRTQLITTVLLGFFSSLLGYLIYFVFRTYPIRKLDGTLVDLQRQTTMLHNILRSATNTAIATTDLDFRITYYNPMAETIFGYSAEQAIGKTVQEVHTREKVAQKRFIDAIEEVRNKGEYRYGLEQITDQGIRYIESRVAGILSPEGELVGYSLFSQDVTDRRRAEEEKRRLEGRLQRSEKMEALGQLAGGVAHDLNNVLGVLSGYSELLIERMEEGNSLRKYAENILKSSEKGAAIIQDLLTLARRGVSTSEVININNTVSDFLKSPFFEKLQACHPRIIFRTELDKSLLNIKGSPIHLEKTLMNLIANAVEAIAENGEVTVRTENRYLDRIIRGYDEIKEGDYAILTVSDSGIGIETADLDRIFEPFYTKKIMGGSGTGLGLAVVWGTVKDHNGYIDVQSEYGKGSTFTLYLPVTRDKTTKDLQKIPLEQYLGHGESVLVVDDVHEQREVATGMLVRLGYKVTAVSSGTEAVDYLKSNKADIIVLDMIMEPGIDGLETYKRILEINPHQKAIITSGFSETERVRQAQELGVGSYVKKPYLMERVGVAIRAQLEEGR